MRPFENVVLKYQVETEATFPTAAEMAAFDTLEIDLTMDCPDAEGGEFGNCGEWDYLAHIRLWDEASQGWVEMARFITTYHRQGRYVVDHFEQTRLGVAIPQSGGMPEDGYPVVLYSHGTGGDYSSAFSDAVTGRLARVGELVGIPLLDHVVVGDGRFVSVRERMGDLARLGEA